VWPGLRRYPAEKHRIFYAFNGRTIEIIRILHVGMDVEAHLPGNEN
jgi:plasmid stabilization system protein ParE